MNPFQWITLFCLGSLLCGEAYLFIRHRAHWARIALRSLVWLSALCAILYPRLSSDIAQFVGIERGANLVLYTLCLTFLVTTFFMYSLYVGVRGEITQLVRHIAIREASRKGPAQSSQDESVSR